MLAASIRHSMNTKKNLPATDTRATSQGIERRRIGRIVHDDRGNASVDWLDAPANYKRMVLEIEEEVAGTLSIQQAPRTFNPYERDTLPEPKKTSAPRKDLRKLSEWIKMMRDLEERKRRGEVD
jgi:hypothetical protein